jgi:hypothetical protein
MLTSERAAIGSVATGTSGRQSQEDRARVAGARREVEDDAGSRPRSGRSAINSLKGVCVSQGHTGPHAPNLDTTCGMLAIAAHATGTIAVPQLEHTWARFAVIPRRHRLRPTFTPRYRFAVTSGQHSDVAGTAQRIVGPNGATGRELRNGPEDDHLRCLVDGSGNAPPEMRRIAMVASGVKD